MAGEVINQAAEAAHSGVDLVQIVALLGAAVIAVPIFKRLGLGSVLGYLAAGLLIGPFGLQLISDPVAILHTSELGVVMFLFLIGLEMEPQKLWGLRRQIFGLGALQVGLCTVLLTLLGLALGFAPPVAFVLGAGFVMTSTAIVMQMLAERGELANPSGQKMVSILLLEDIAIVPLLLAVALLAPSAPDASGNSIWISIAVALACVLALGVLGKRVLNPLFRVLANARAREVMTAAALLVVLGSALLFQVGGLSMAMGAFLAGVTLSTSTFRHQLEADIEPFRGILLGLFFLAVGMSLDVSVVVANWQLIALGVVALMGGKGIAIYAIARLLRSSHSEALGRAVLMAQGGEFAFVLFTTAAGVGLIGTELNAIFTAIVIISMVLTPLTIVALNRLSPAAEQSLEGVEFAEGLTGNVLVIGFGRFGQIASQPLLARGHRISIIDNDADMVRAAGTFGFKVYYGDGTRLDILRAAGAGTADAVLIAVDNPAASLRIAGLIRDEFPVAKIMVRAFDRAHAIAIAKIGVEYQVREVFESALAFGAATARLLGATEEEVADVIEGVRDRDRRRFEAQALGGLQAGRELLLSNAEDQARESGAVKGPSEPITPTPDTEAATR
jgi:glutathione-regulated potassium-efflux system protein KefB